METFVVVDLEMTGLKVKTDRILEIGAAKVESGMIVDTFQTFVQPHRKLEERIIELTGIREEDLQGAPDVKEAMELFLEFAGELPLLGHNLIFDYSFLKQAAVNMGVSFERKGVDTLKIARKLLEEPESKSLESLCSYFDIPQVNCHRALDDALATAELYKHLYQLYFEKEPGLFQEKPLQFRVKKQGMLTPAQKRDLNHLIIYHRIDTNVEIDSLTRSEASRMIDKIYAKYGRIPKQEDR